MSGDFALAASKASKPRQLQGFSGAGAPKTMAVGHYRRGLEIDAMGLLISHERIKKVLLRIPSF